MNLMFCRYFIDTVVVKKIKKLLVDMPRLYFIGRTIKRFCDDDYIKMVNECGSGNDIFRLASSFNVKSYGEKNIGINIMLVHVEEGSPCGMGPLFRRAAMGTYLADKFGFIPVIEFGQTAYKERDSVFGTKNVWEYYYCQPRGISLQDAYASSQVWECGLIHTTTICEELLDVQAEQNAGYIVGEKFLAEMGRIAGKYFVLNQQTKDIIESGKAEIFPNESNTKVLAVQIRGTDYALGWEGHPVMAMPEDYFAAIDEALAREFTHIFLATDDSRYLAAFKARYGEKLIYFQDTHRASGTTNISFVKNNRGHNKYLNGLEVLRDMYTIATCDGFIAGLSQVSICARIIRYSMGKPFEYQKIIDKGIYHH